MQILNIKSSILDSYSKSSYFGNKLIEKIKKENDILVVRDVEKNPISILNSKNLQELQKENSEIKKEFIYLIEELKNSDVIIIEAPMYNFNIPVQLKAYFDAITQKEITFKYVDGSPKGLLENKKVYVILSRGGEYLNKLSFQEDYLKLQLSFIGLTNVEWIFIEGTAYKNQEDLENQFNKKFKE